MVFPVSLRGPLLLGFVETAWRKRVSMRQGWGRRVAYSSQFLDRVNRAHRGQAKIKGRLQANCDLELWELPPKPKGCGGLKAKRTVACE